MYHPWISMEIHWQIHDTEWNQIHCTSGQYRFGLRKVLQSVWGQFAWLGALLNIFGMMLGKFWNGGSFGSTPGLLWVQVVVNSGSFCCEVKQWRLHRFFLPGTNGFPSKVAEAKCSKPEFTLGPSWAWMCLATVEFLWDHFVTILGSCWDQSGTFAHYLQINFVESCSNEALY